MEKILYVLRKIENLVSKDVATDTSFDVKENDCTEDYVSSQVYSISSPDETNLPILVQKWLP